MKSRLDQLMVSRKIAPTRSQASNYIRLNKVEVGGKIISKPGTIFDDSVNIKLLLSEQYVSRAGLKLASVAEVLGLDFKDKIVLDVGSSTGGFTDYALQHGASRVIAVDVGTDQMHPSLLGNYNIELHEKTDIRDMYLEQKPDIIVIDVSFISVRQILPHIASNLTHKNTQIVTMLKPQFEAGREQTNKGIIKNDSVRRKILKEFEAWAKQTFIIQDKRDSGVSGAGGNQERFYLLKVLQG